MRNFALLIVGSIVLVLSGCNTWHGAKQDARTVGSTVTEAVGTGLEKAGSGVEKAGEKVKESGK